MKKNTNKMINMILVLLIIAGISVPVIFTTYQMGFFSPEPTVTTEIKETAADAPVLKIATDYDFCPNSYYNKDNELSGLYIEIMTEAANRLGMKPEFETSTWMGCRKMLTDGEVDVLLGLEIFSNMEGTLRTIPVCSDELCVYGKDEVQSAASLAGKKVALMTRSVIESTYDLQCDYIEYSTNTEILEAVESGEVDYGICHGAVASKIIEKNRFHLKQGVAIAKSYPALAVRENQVELRKKLNTVLQEMSVDGTIRKLQNKWITEFTRNRSLEYVLQQNEIFYITYILCIIILLCIVYGFKVNYKRQEEHIRTLLEYQEKLQKSNEETQKANRAKSAFLSHMSHDIRTPMNGIMGMVEIIKKNLDNRTKVEECLDKIDLASHHLLSLINDVLDMSKIGSEEIQLEEIPFDLNTEIEKIHAMVDTQAADKQIDFQIHAEEIRDMQLIGSPAHIRRILLNLISNALRYNKPKGSITVSIREIPNRKDTDSSFFEFKVADTGIGMSQEFIRESLFKPFTQAADKDDARTDYQGTGLGMSIVNELVQGMNGRISVESEVGKGTTFTVLLPLKLNQDKIQTGKEQTAEQEITGIKVLVVEDNDLNLEIIQFMLEEAGAQVSVARNGKEALEQFEHSKPGEIEVILMDIMMPVMDGLEATRRIRSLEREDAKEIPIIAMTANAFAEDRRQSKEAGMNEHLSKPVDGKKLFATLAKYKNKGSDKSC